MSIPHQGKDGEMIAMIVGSAATVSLLKTRAHRTSVWQSYNQSRELSVLELSADTVPLRKVDGFCISHATPASDQASSWLIDLA